MWAQHLTNSPSHSLSHGFTGGSGKEYNTENNLQPQFNSTSALESQAKLAPCLAPALLYSDSSLCHPKICIITLITYLRIHTQQPFWPKNLLSSKSQSTFLKSSAAAFFFFFLFSFFFFGCPMAYGVPRPKIRFEAQLQPMPHLWHLRILNPQCWAGDQTCIPVLQRYHQSHCATVGAPSPQHLSVSEPTFPQVE